MAPNVELITVVWGVMLDWYLKAGLPSLLQTDNIPFSKSRIARYTFYTNEEHKLRADPNFTTLCELIPVEVKPLLQGPHNVNACFIDAVERDFTNQWFTLIIQPEAIFGNKSIAGITYLCQQNLDMILVCFPRTNLNTVDLVAEKLQKDKIITNRELVRLAMDNIHWETPYPGSGVEIKKISETRWDVHHSVPNPFFKPNEGTLAYMRSNATRNSGIDHVLPMLYVKTGGKYHYVSDSDIFFMIEPTDRGIALCQEVGRPRDFADKSEENRKFWAPMSQVWHCE